MKRYILVCAQDYTEFVDAVNERMAEGYEPQGGLLKERIEYSHDGYNEVGNTFYQAMVLPRKVTIGPPHIEVKREVACQP